MIVKLFLCLAVWLEGGALPFLLLTHRYADDWGGLLLVHAMLSLAVGLLGRDCLPLQYRTNPGMVTIFFSAFTLFIPILGAIGVLALVILTNMEMHQKEDHSIQALQESRFNGAGRTSPLSFVGGDLQARFQASALRTESRLDALGKLQGFETHQIQTTVRQALQDHADDIRLVAFGILDKKEKSINERINQELTWYHESDEASSKLTHARQLAYAYWELVYKGVVEGDILLYALEQASHYNSMVLATDDSDAGMWALQGQIALRAGKNDLARTAFMKALDYGIPETRVVPYLAELAFSGKQFSELLALMETHQTLSQVSILDPVLRYWESQNLPFREYATT